MIWFINIMISPQDDVQSETRLENNRKPWGMVNRSFVRIFNVLSADQAILPFLEFDLNIILTFRVKGHHQGALLNFFFFKIQNHNHDIIQSLVG